MKLSLPTCPVSAPPAARLFLGLLERIAHGHLELVTPDRTRLLFGDAHAASGASLHVHDWRACERILRAGDIGFAEAYQAGWIDTPDLAALLRLALRNERMLERALFGGVLARCWYRLRHWLRPNSRHGSRRNIHAHYDIGNAFYQLWLDRSWTYSSALFHGDFGQPLEQAQANKYQRIIDTLGLTPGQRVLEIGCGWGGFAEHAARQGIAVHGVTISPSQLAVAKERIAAGGLTELARLELRDYRDLDGEYDAVVSIEMFEAVGERYWRTYFDTVARRLRRGGGALIQTITIGEPYFARYRATADFIQEFIFPGGMLPTVTRFEQEASRAGLPAAGRLAFGADYAETLRRWNLRFQDTRAHAAAQGLDERFLRIWHLYFAYCEAGFDEGRTDVVQFHLQKA